MCNGKAPYGHLISYAPSVWTACARTRGAGPGLSRLGRLCRLQDGQMHLLATCDTRTYLSAGYLPMEQYHLVRLGMASGIGSKASIGRDLCNDTRCRPRGRLSITWYMYFAHGTPEAFLSLESSPVETRRPPSRYVIIPYAHDSFSQ
ncbi:hypothetical protein CI102_5357 [Trichoderma harzianum]|nr:hypothetical protein CI102_5357 [Trichoderma harzianum]